MTIETQEVKVGGAIVPLLAAFLKGKSIELTEDDIHRAYEIVRKCNEGDERIDQVLSLTLEERGYHSPDGYTQSTYLLCANRDKVAN